jgi:hypothetical protein
MQRLCAMREMWISFNIANPAVVQRLPSVMKLRDFAQHQSPF